MLKFCFSVYPCRLGGPPLSLYQQSAPNRQTSIYIRVSHRNVCPLESCSPTTTISIPLPLSACPPLSDSRHATLTLVIFVTPVLRPVTRPSRVQSQSYSDLNRHQRTNNNHVRATRLFVPQRSGSSRIFLNWTFRRDLCPCTSSEDVYEVGRKYLLHYTFDRFQVLNLS